MRPERRSRISAAYTGAGTQWSGGGREWLAAWQTVEFDYELIDAGDRFVVLLDQRMRGRSTGVEVELGKYAHVGTFNDGRMTHWKMYASQSKALEVTGLEE